MDFTQLSQINDVVQRSGLDDKRKRNEAIRQGLYDPGTFEQNYSKEIQESRQPSEMGFGGIDQGRLSWDQISSDNAYQGMNLDWLPNYQNNNYSDRVVDLNKFGINYNIPMLYPGSARFEGGSDGMGSPTWFDDSIQTYGNIRLNGSDIQKLTDGNWNTVDQWGQYDRDASDIMGWLDPRQSLIMSDASGWNDPLSNWLQSKGDNFVADTLGRLSFGARRGDSSSAGYSPQTWWPQNMTQEEAQSVFGMSPDQYGNIKSWANDYFSSGAQSARHDAMFGSDSFFGDLLSFAGPVLSFIPGLQPVGMALSGLNALANDNPLGALMSFANLGGFGLGDIFGGGMDPSGLDAINGMDLASDMASGVSPSLSSQLTNAIQGLSNSTGIPNSALLSGGAGALLSAAKGGNPLEAGFINGISDLFGGSIGGAPGKAAQYASSFGLNQLFNKNNMTPGQQSINSMLATMPVVNQAAQPQQMSEQQQQQRLKQLQTLASLYRTQ